MIQPWSTVVPRQRVVISDENMGPIVNIGAWLGMTIMVLCVLTRVVSKYTIVRRATVDDGLIIATMVFAAVHTITLSSMVTNGLGRPQESLDDKTIEKFQKFGYTSQLMYVPALALAKLSTIVYLRALSPAATFVIVNQILEGFVTVWAIAAEFSIAFQCALPRPWAIITSKCFDTVAFWNATGFFDILTDVAIIVLPAYLVWRVQMPNSKKVLVVVVFGTRIFIIPLTIWRLHVLNTDSAPSVADQTLSSYHGYLATTVQLNFAIVAACIPFLKPFMESMNSGSYIASAAPMDASYGAGSKLNSHSGDTSRKAAKPKGSIKLESISGSRTPEPHNMNSHPSRKRPTFEDAKRGGSGSSSDDFHFGVQDRRRNDLGRLRPDKGTNFTHIGRATPEENQARSSIESDSMIIRQTTEWDIQESYEQFKPGDPSQTSRATADSASDQAEKDWRRGGPQGHSVI